MGVRDDDLEGAVDYIAANAGFTNTNGEMGMTSIITIIDKSIYDVW